MKTTIETAKLAREKGLDFRCILDKFFNTGSNRCSQSNLAEELRHKYRIRPFVENKVCGDFGFVIYTKNPKRDEIASLPWIRNSYFTLHFATYEEALEKALQESLKLI